MWIVLLASCELLTLKPMLPCRDTGGDGQSWVPDTGGEGQLWFSDVDGDGYGAGQGQAEAGATGSWVDVGGDCDDDDPYAYPGAEELCDDQPNDCDTIDAWSQALGEAGVITWAQPSGVQQNLSWSGAVSFSGEGVVTLCPDPDLPFVLNLTLDSPGSLVVERLKPGTPGLLSPAILSSAANEQAVVTVVGGDISLDGLSLTGAISQGDGGGLRIEGGSVYLLVTELTGNIAGRGGGLFVAGGTAALEDSSIALNTATSGAGIYAEGAVLSTVRLELRDNTATGGPGGAAVLIDSTVSLSDTTVRQNAAAAEVGGLYQDGGEVRCSQTKLGGASSPGTFLDNEVSGVSTYDVRLLSGVFSSGQDGDGCWFGQSVWTPAGDYLPSDPFVFVCDESGCSP